MATLPETYSIAKFNEYAGLAESTKGGKEYIGCCNQCREGKSWGKSKRLHFYVETGTVNCFNCGYNEGMIKYIMDSGFMTFKEVMEESKGYDTIKVPDKKEVYITKKQEIINTTINPLPSDAIDLLDKTQLKYYKDNKIVKDAFNYLNNRGILRAVNRPKSFFISLSDFIHKNRIIIPSYDITNRIVHYQSRILYPDERNIRYISKMGSQKTVFNINNVNYDDLNIYIFEGAFNACFVKNGVAISGITLDKEEYMTAKQKAQLDSFVFHKKILVLDNQWIDNTALEKSIAMVEKGEDVFIWPEKYKNYKDINDLALASGLHEIKSKFILMNIFPKEEALRILKSIKK